MTKTKPISIRLNDDEQERLKEYMAANYIKKTSVAIRAMAFLKPKTKIDTSSIVETTPEKQGIKYYAKLSLIPPNLPNVKAEIDKYLRGQKSDLVKTLFKITPESLNRAFTCATPKGIITLIPSMHAIPSTTTHDNKGGLA
ncbi:hypothetical protein ES702_02587 [subsurface metagenome]